MRQLTVAVAFCGKAFSACPALSIVVTQVVRVVPTNSGLPAIACAAAASCGLAANARSACTGGSRRHLADRAEVSAGKVVRHGREIIVVDARDRSCDLVDCVVRTWARAVPALIGRRQLERGVGLLGALHQVDDRPSVRRQQPAASVRVDGIFGALHPRMRRDLASGAVRLVERRLLVADEGEDQCPARLGLLQPQDGRHQGGDAGLVVDRAASVEIAAFFDQLVRIALPVLRPCIDDVHVGREEDRLRIPVGARDANEHADGFPVRKLGDVLGRNASVPEHGFEVADHGRHLALALRCPEGDDLLVDLSGLRVVRTLLSEGLTGKSCENDTESEAKRASHRTSPD